ncbi:hypothetical protein QO008_001029 [Peptoniphilus ivorii]|uniref:DNA double-strand break repair nuclease NurA n=1 Tax=Aedoeadaptatus ivorii TaxID=54006 RepID=UPI0027827A71|nr:DNA double-strand break repair nuclease NurA [Peptoniphilus ivorii]MDQ0508570.1 hypothetical protein [Peptoniphilus ivorii]
MRQEDIVHFQRQIEALNDALHRKYDGLLSMTRADLGKRITPEIGTFTPLTRLSDGELRAVGSLYGVDGSTAGKGGAHPHYVLLFQGLALSTRGAEERVRKLYTPVLTDDDAVTAEKLADRYLAESELEAAIRIVEEDEDRKDPAVLIMDGGLLRYKIHARDKWEELRALCLREGVLLVGAIKDVKTREIASRTGKEGFYDREFLAGKLDYGELLLLAERDEEDAESKESAGLRSGFYRPSKRWEVVGLDVLEEQADRLVSLARLLFTLTPQRGRGVPYWIDVVDKRAKISPRDMEMLLEEGMDRDLMERFFVSERERRV